MKQFTVQTFALLTVVVSALATPAPIRPRDLSDLCGSPTYHCVYKDSSSWIQGDGGIGCEGNTCAFFDDSLAVLECPNGASVSISFGDPDSSISTSGDITAYFSSTGGSQSWSTGDDAHVSCGSW